MHQQIYTFLCIYTIISIFSITNTYAIDSCAKNAPKTFSKDQTKLLCSRNIGDGPGLCAIKAKKTLSSLTFDQILDLCHNSLDDIPGQCIANAGKLRVSSSNDIKIQLCKNAKTILPADCMAALKKSLHSSSSKDEILMANICQNAISTGPAKCASAMKKDSFSNEFMVAICKGAKDDGPAKCASNKKLVKDLTETSLLKLCQGAIDDAPIQCLKQAPNKYTDVEKVTLCTKAQSDAPAMCASKFKYEKKMPTALQIKACVGAKSNKRAQCILDSPKKLTYQQAVLLCKNAEVHDPISCYNKIRSIDNVDTKIQICSENSDTPSVDCVKAAPYDFNDAEKLKLCKGARTSTAPAVCAKEMISVLSYATRSAQIDNNGIIISLCRGTKSNDPINCFKEGKRIGVDVEMSAKVCNGAENFAPAECAAYAKNKLNEELTLRLCQGIRDVGPALCALDVPSGIGFSNDDLLILCHNSDSKAPSTCIRHLPNSFTSTQKAKICAQSTNLDPVDCAKAVNNCVSREIVANLCSNAESSLPGYCINSLLTCDVSEVDVYKCRKDIAVPSAIKIEKIHYDGEFLQTGTNILSHITLMDQYGMPMATDGPDAIYVRAWIDLKDSDGAHLIGDTMQQLQNTSSFMFGGGFAVSQHGEYTLHYGIGEKIMASIRLLVIPNEEELRRIQCGPIFSGFNSYVLHEPVRNMERQAFIPLQQLLQMSVNCVDLLHDSGLKVKHGWSGYVWIWYRPGIDSLELGVGLPSTDMSDWEKLELPVGSTKKQIRKAYHSKSLQWHPDKWAASPLYEERAQNVFALIGEAYQRLMSQTM